MGQQWIVYDRGRWRPKNLPTWFPRAMTNKVSEKINDFVTTLLQSGRVPINYLPSRGDEPDDKAIAEIGERIRDVMYEEASIDDESRAHALATWVASCGNGFLIPYYDHDGDYGTASIAMQQCAQCGTQMAPKDIVDSGGKCSNEQCGGVNFSPAMDESGQPVTQDFPVGKFCTDVCSPFEIRWDHRIVNYSEHRRFTRMRMWDLDFAKEKYKEIANQITADHENDLGQFYLNALAHVTSSFGQTGGFIGGASNPLGPKTVVYEHYELPDDHYPEGIKCTRVGANSDLIVEAGPLPSEYSAGPRKGQKFLPLIHFGFDIVAGRLWRKTRIDDVIPLQMFRNMVEAALRLTAQRMSNPVWLNPKGSGVSNFTGEPGQILDYNPMSVGGTSFAKPERIPAELSNVGPLIQLMNKIDDSIERVMGTFFLQGGDAPPGVTAACHDDKVQCLTRTGWKFHHEVSVGDEIYSMDPTTEKGVWTKITKLNVYENYQGDMYEIGGRDIQALATPNHAWYVSEKTRAGFSPLKRIETKDLHSKHYIPARVPLGREEKHWIDAYVELAGWVFTEGCYAAPSKERRTKHWTIAVTQSFKVNALKCARIEKTLERLDIPFHKYKRTDGRFDFRIYGAFADDFVAAFPDKRPSFEWMHTLSQKQLSLLVETMVDGDGHNRKSKKLRKNEKNPPKEKIYCSADPILLDRFQIIATLAGWPTATHEYKNTKKRKRKSDRYVESNLVCALKRMKHFQWYSLNKKTRIVKFQGTVWCPTTETATWVARKNGLVWITGNSALAYL